MIISDDIVPGAATHTGPVLIYLVCGKPERGFVLGSDEFVTSLAAQDEARALAGLPPVPLKKKQTDLL